MGRIKKVAGPKHEATVSKAIADFATRASSIPISQLPALLHSFPQKWPLPRGDLYHWIPVLNRFDNILEQIIKEYGLDEGPQSKPFGTILLERGVAGEGKSKDVIQVSREEVESHGFAEDGDRQLAEDILNFSRTLLENCGNRSLYASSERLGELLNTTSLPLLANVLLLLVRLAQRYHASRQRSSNVSQSFNNALLASHYNIDLEKVQKLAEPFVKQASSQEKSGLQSSSKKGKEKASSSRRSSDSANVNDLLELLRRPSTSINGSAKSPAHPKDSEHDSRKWEEWGNVSVHYFRNPDTVDAENLTTPGPRRASTFPKPSRLSNSDGSPNKEGIEAYVAASKAAYSASIDISSSQIRESAMEDLIRDNLTGVARDVSYDVLCRIRVAHAVTDSPATRAQILSIRLLALTNLAYIYSEETFKQKILQRDSDEPRSLQIVQQLCDLLSPPTSKNVTVPLELQTTVLGTLEAFAKLKTKAADICAALSINVNHGVLFQLLRSAVTEMKNEGSDESDARRDDWREAGFALLETLPQCTPRAGESLISAGLLSILVELLNLRTPQAERSFPKTLTFLNNLVGPVRDAFETLASANGLEAISGLLQHEVNTALEQANAGQGLPQEFRNRTTDYQIPFSSQQTLRMIFKITREMMTNNSGNFSRLLRNFIESPVLLNGLQTVIVNPDAFGSSVWSGAVNIMSSFIHNEPTSYTVVSEAGLSRGFLDTISTEIEQETISSEINAPEATENAEQDDTHDDSSDDGPVSDPSEHSTESLMSFFASKVAEQNTQGDNLGTQPKGILPAGDAIISIPHAIGALCLNHAGMSALKKTNALENFFRIFESPLHVKTMSVEQELAQVLGSSFDELVRHHPALRIPVLKSLLTMILRVKALILSKGTKADSGAKIWLQKPDANSRRASEAQGQNEASQDVIMSDVDAENEPVRKVLSADEPLPPSSDGSESTSDVTILDYLNATVKFLSGLVENHQMVDFLGKSGAADQLLELATLPIMRYDCNNHMAFIELRRVLRTLADKNPITVLPAIAQRTKDVLHTLRPLLSHQEDKSFFAEFTTPGSERDVSSTAISQDGTQLVQALVHAHTLSSILSEILLPTATYSRSQPMPFSQVNLTDVYADIIKAFGLLHRICVWEDILLMKRLPSNWAKSTPIKGHSMGSTQADEVLGVTPAYEDMPGLPSSHGSAETSPSRNLGSPDSRLQAKKHCVKIDKKSATFRNTRTLRFLLSQVPSSIISLMQNLGKAVSGKRRSHSSDGLYNRQSAILVSEAISTGFLSIFSFDPPRRAVETELHTYWMVILSSLSNLMIEGEGPHQHVLTLLLYAFKKDGGLDLIENMLKAFSEQMSTLTSPVGKPLSPDVTAKLLSAHHGIEVILDFYKPILAGKPVVESAQSTWVLSSDSRSNGEFYFNPKLLLIDIRAALLPVVRSLWDSSFVEKAPSSIIKKVIEIMRTILEASEEHGAPRSTPEPSKKGHKIYDVDSDKVESLTAEGFEEGAVQEALYRCFNSLSSAETYCQRLKRVPGAQPLPIPDYDRESTKQRDEVVADADQIDTPAQQVQQDTDDAPLLALDADTSAAAAGLALLSQGDRLQSSGAPDQQGEANTSGAVDNSATRAGTSSDLPPIGDDAPDPMAMSLDLEHQQNMLPDMQAQATEIIQRLGQSFPSASRSASRSISRSTQPAVASTSLDELNTGRGEVRKGLIDRGLDILNVHDDVSFELSDLVTAATSKASDVKGFRTEVGQTLIQSLISFELDEEDPSTGKKIASYANLLALVLQSKEFFDACTTELKENFEYLTSFVKLTNNVQAGVQSSPWICQTLLVIEKVLSEDAQPPQIKTPSSPEGQITISDVLDFDPPLVSREAKSDLFEALLKLMPCTGKDEAMVLSITRILVVLTRDRGIASSLAEKKNIQRFFLMIKQLSGMVDDKLPGTIMIVVRHMFETDDIIRRIMRSEIRSNSISRANRSPDLFTYVKNLHHLAIRSPEIFVEATNESLELYPYDPSNPKHSMLKLRSEVDTEIPEALHSQTKTDEVTPESKKASPTENQTADKSPSLDGEASTTTSKSKAAEKVPTVDQPSGVIHYLLSELLSYKDTDDSGSHGPRLIRPPITPRPSENDHSPGPSTPEATNDSSSGNSSPAPTDAKRNEFKPEQHPIHTYRCFILQCLTEVLQSYNQAKVEFINFSRKVDGKASTPSKPRSSVLNYLLNDAIPVGLVGTEETVSYKKREITSNWAISVVVALCTRTSEDNSFMRGEDYDEDQVELTFVRKFVLEHALKAYKDASISEEDLSPKYGRLLDLADLFNRLLIGQLLARHMSPPPGPDARPQKAIAKLMFEKGFIAALTSSISEINLGYKGADRAVRYILKPLKQLSAAAIELSELSDISTTPGPSDEDEDDISSATSVSEAGNGREDTPDLFRNSTLGMFEPDREGSSDSESSRSEDEEMYEDEYEDGMDYDDPDPEDMISDEEEEMDGMGSIEGLSGNHHMDVIIDDEDDDEDTDEDDDDDEDDDEDDEMGNLEEINADNDNASLGDDNGAEWEDEDEMSGELHDDDFDEDEQIDIDDVAREVIEEAGGPGAALQRLEGIDDRGHANLIMDVATGQYMNDIVRPDEENEDDDEDEDGEDMDDDEGAYDDYDDGSPAGIPARIPDWGWDDEDETFVLDHHHRHHHPSARRMRAHQIADPWTVFPNGPPRMTAPYHRAHRPHANPRPTDDGINPLLQRADRTPTSVPMMRDPMGLSDLFFPRHGSGPTPALDSGLFIRQVLQSLGTHDSGVTAVPGPGGNLHIQITGRPGDEGSPLNLLRMSNFSSHRHLHETGSTRSEIRSSLASFTPQGALQRWTEEAKLLFASDAQARAARVLPSLLKSMVPLAEEKKQKREADEKKIREEAEQKKEQEKKEHEERELKEKEEREKREAEEAAEAAAAAQARAEAEAEAAARLQPAEGTTGTSNAEPMEGVEQGDDHTDPSVATDASQAGDSTPTASVSQPVERQYVLFNNTQLDITDMGIDRAYLDALPEEIRNEVLMSQLAMQRAQTAAAGEPPTEIDNEFLEALPAEIRQELLQQEAQERRRRERQDAQRQQAAAGGAPRAEEMDPASFFASLDPAIRQTVLMEQDEDILAQLPEQLAAEARALMGGRGGHPFGAAASLARTARRREMLSRSLQTHHTKKPPRKPIVQILDKAGVATLLRLMFIQLSGQMQEPLQKIFEDAVQNRQNRAEIISMLLSLLNEGSVDAASMERSYALISARSKQPFPPKTALKRTITDTSMSAFSTFQDLKCTPLSVIHQCLAVLVHLVSRNQHLPSFFLSEVDAASLSKGKASKKGKGKETKASRYPINTLLSLLDRSLVTENVVCVERLADLLQRITYPLIVHWKKENEAAKEEKKAAAAATSEQAGQGAPSTTDGAAAGESTTTDTNVLPASDSAEQMSDVQPTGFADDAAAGASGNTTSEVKDKPEATPESQEKEAVKKPRSNPPPVIPQENLALVINVIMARECPSNTFRATLSTMTNLSILPGAKEVFGQRLVACALELGELVLNDLNELIPQIEAATTGGELQAVALTKFSPQSSDQAKLLRILKALDYLFDPKREEVKAKANNEEKDGADAAKSSKADLVTTLYENATFSLLWDRLSECLRAINQATGMLNVATILLPLVEALMVVCTNTTTKDAPLAKFVKEITVSSPAPESQMESIFFRFTEEHRKILNELVRHNPKLMSGTFQLLVKNPKVLDFDNKRNYFGRRLHQRDTQTRHPQPPLSLNVRRDQVFLDSFKFLSFKSGDEIKYGKLNIRFSGEEGVDAGGVTREWFQVMSRQMFNPDYALFIPVASDRTTFHPNKLSKINEEHLMFFKFIGRIIGKALYEGRALDCHFSRAVYKRILGQTVSLKDMETLDLEYYRNVLWMLGNDITEIITETMSVETDDFGVTEIVDLVPNGRNIPVSEENKQEYVQLVVEHRLVGAVEEQLQKFLEGFHDIVPPSLISIFNEQELELLISGLPDIDVDDWKSHTDYQNYSASSPQIQWFWRAVRSFDKEERAKLLQFVTGTSKVPLNGFGQLEGMNGFSRFNIHRDYGNKERLPSSHTCFNQLDLPEYEDYEALRKQLYTAMTAGSEYFGFA